MSRPVARSFLIAFVCLVGLADPSAPASAADGIAIRGQVLDSDGQPIADARVVLEQLADPLTRARLELGLTEAEPVALARTASDGRFRLLAPAAGLWRARIEAPGFVPQQASLTPLIEPVDLPPVELDDDAGLTVKLVDAGGSPVAGALVRLVDPTERFRLGDDVWTPTARHGLTGADGLALLARGAREASRLAVSSAEGGFRELERVRGTATTIRLDQPRVRAITAV
ncbi:MAG: carboxypeptidase regulatory-like domain-containing protein, partial [Acidobacteriota bacterium]